MQVVRGGLPELPWAKRERFVREYGISSYDAGVLADDLELSRYFEAAAQGAKRPKAVANYVLNDLLSALSGAGKSVEECPIRPQHLAELSGLIEDGKITSKQGKEVFAEMFASGETPEKIGESNVANQESAVQALSLLPLPP